VIEARACIGSAPRHGFSAAIAKDRFIYSGGPSHAEKVHFPEDCIVNDMEHDPSVIGYLEKIALSCFGSGLPYTKSYFPTRALHLTSVCNSHKLPKLSY
jgi:hypothetical protein